MGNNLEASDWFFEGMNPDLSPSALLDDLASLDAPDQQRESTRRQRDDDDQSPVSEEALSRCAPYTMKWTLCQKKTTRITKLTENAVQNLEEYPSSFWETSFKSEIGTIIDEKRLSNTHEPDETQVVVSINARGEEDIPKRFPGLEIDWSDVDDQVDSWADLVRDGRKLTIRVTFIFKEADQAASKKRGQGRQSATSAQLVERNALHADQSAPNDLPIWEQVYTLLECPGSGCDVGPYCWRNPATGSRHAVPSGILVKIVDYAEKGGKMKEHSDIPKHIQHEILNPPSKRKQAEGSQINITNVIPALEGTPPAKKIKISGHRDEAIERYRDWHCRQVTDTDWKREFHAIAQLTRLARLSLDRLHEAQEEETQYFVSNKISRGIARQWVSMVDQWLADKGEVQ